VRRNSIELTEEKFLNSLELNSLRELFTLSPIETLPLRLLLELGMRGAELLQTQASDLDHASKTLFIRAVKGSKDRRLPLTPESYALLCEITASSGPHDLIFPFTTRTLRRLWDKHRLNRTKGVHCLRHTFAVELYKRRKDLMLVKTALGHRSFKSTQVYADFVYGAEELSKMLHAS